MAHDAEDLRAGFADPPKPEYGNVPFWWWDGDELSEERITDQLETLSERGVEAVCFEQKYPHGPPEGPDVPYFSEEWWGYMEHTVEECDRLGMSLWIHDETYHHSPPSWKRYWQSRAEEAIEEHPEFQGHVLDQIAERVRAGESADLDVPAAFTPFAVAAYPVDSDGTLSVEEAVEFDVPDGESTVSWTAPEGRDEWHLAAIGYRPRGLCRTTRDVVDWIVENHYEAYVDRLGDALGDTIVGTFQDELFVLQGTVPCDDRLLDRYRAEWGDDLGSGAIALFEDCGEGTAATRSRYWDVVVTMLEENWFRPLYEWHERRGLQFAHDNWGREDLTEHATEYGDYVRTMRWFQEPGYDDGGRFEGVGTRTFFDAKVAASIAACYDRDRVWGELFHTTGWGFPLDLHFAGIAENACYGLDRYNKHGLYYATLGGWYEHAPPDTHFRQPYWAHADAFNDAVARLMYLCSEGDRVVDAAMLYPIESIQANRLAGPDPAGPEGTYRPRLTDAAHEIDERTREISEKLYEAGTDLLFVDHETIRDGSVSNGDLAFAGRRAGVVVLGPVTAVRREVAESLVDLVDDGGAIVSVGRLPTETVEGGTQDPALERLHDRFGDPDQPGEPPSELASTEREGGGVAIRAPSVEAAVDRLADHVAPDVRTPEDVYHAHRRVGDYETYLLLNTRDEARTIDVDVRATGRPERWQVEEGSVEPIHAYETDGDYTTIELDFAPHEFHVVGIDAGADVGEEPTVVDTSLSTVDAVTETDDGARVSGVTDAAGRHHATVARGSSRTSGESDRVSPPDSVALDDGWTFALEPTMHNEWGDFRHPASDELIGPEVREFEHRAEGPDEDGIAREWHQESAVENREGADGDDWERTRWSYGQRFWRLPDADGPVSAPPSDRTDWEPYAFSTRVGKPGTHPDDHGHNGVVSDDFLVAPESDGPTHFWTTVHVDEETRVACHVGDGIQSLSIDGEEVDEARSQEASDGGGSDPFEHTLPEGTSAVHLVVEPDTQTHVAFEPTPASAHRQDMAYVPRLRWFHGTDALDFDPRPWTDERVEWFRFAVPVGTTAFTVPVQGNSRVWIDGEERSVDADERVAVPEPREEPGTVAIRTVGESVPAGGARWEGPVEIETDAATVGAGDWRDLGLAEYSGIGVYRRTVSVPECDEDDRVVLDLGDVATSARVFVDGERVGTTFAAPHEVDLTDAVSPGEDHLIEVEVANTLANHFATETPSRYVYEGQRESGLLGPVEIRVRKGVTIGFGARP